MDKSKKVYRVIKKILNIASVTLLVFVFAVLCIALVMRFTGNKGGIFGIHINVIATGSMEPEIKVGDVIISKSYSGQELKVGDVVSYVSKSGEIAGNLITHQIIAIEEDANGLVITTKGTASATADAPIKDSEIVSVMLFNSKLIGFIYGIITHPVGFIAIVVVPLIWTVVGEARSIYKEFKSKKEAE